jgi:RNA polymerase sigma-70 factor (ECF subfamily)
MSTKEISANQTSFDQLYRDYYTSLLKVVRHKISCQEIAEDVLHDAFIKIWIALPNYDPDKGSIYTWMAKICSHMALDQLNSKSYRKQNITGQLEPEIKNLNRRQCAVLNTDQIDVLLQVRRLQKTYTEPLLLYSTGYTHTEIGNLLDLPLGTVKSRIRAGLIILRKRWAYDALPSRQEV